MGKDTSGCRWIKYIYYSHSRVNIGPARDKWCRNLVPTSFSAGTLAVTVLSSWHWCFPGISCSVPLTYHCQLLCFSSTSVLEAVCGLLYRPGVFWWNGTSDSMTCLAGMSVLEDAAGLVWRLELCTLQIYCSCLVGRTFELSCTPWQVLFFRRHNSLQKKLQVTISIKSKWMNRGLELKVYFGWCCLTEGMYPPIFTKGEREQTSTSLRIGVSQSIMWLLLVSFIFCIVQVEITKTRT